MATATRPPRNREISPHCEDIPAGWPRPFYMEDGHRKYTQWSSAKASDQIFACSEPRTYCAAKNHLCSACGEQMERGLIFDRHWVVKAAGDMPPETVVVDRPQYKLDLRALGQDDLHIGSPICFRCSLFALKHCPYFSAMSDAFGEDMVWIVTTSPSQYREVDESGGLEVLDPDAHHRITTGGVLAEVRAKRLYLTGRPESEFSVDQCRPKKTDEFGWRAPVIWDPSATSEDHD